MLKKSRKILKNQKGLTLVEIGIALVIIALLALVLINVITSGIERTRTTDAQNTLRAFSSSFEQMVMEYSGLPSGNATARVNALNRYFPEDLLINTTAGTNGYESAKRDPWNERYLVTFGGSGTNWWVKARTKGQNQTFNGTTLTEFENGDDYAIITHYVNGHTVTCTVGFERDEGQALAGLNGCVR